MTEEFADHFKKSAAEKGLKSRQENDDIYLETLPCLTCPGSLTYGNFQLLFSIAKNFIKLL
jgi:hypothetical protein